MIHVFESTDVNSSDISCSLPKMSYDEFRQMADSYDSFMDHLRRNICISRNIGIEVAIGGERVSKAVDFATGSINKQNEMAELIYTASEQSTTAINEIAINSQEISSSTTTNLESARIFLCGLRKPAVKYRRSAPCWEPSEIQLMPFPTTRQILSKSSH
ncbi:MAG: methyl-accepting chemotaxis protein [Geovibrio sp.]|nr:methyl-accepting chemotaxis protein [Geovibrio sp.]